MEQNRVDEIIYITGLIKKSWIGGLSEAEQAELDDWKNRSEANHQLAEEINAADIAHDLLALEQYDVTSAKERIFSKIQGLNVEPVQAATPVVRIFQLKAMRWAAAAILFFAIAGTGWYLSSNRTPASAPVQISRAVKVVPGGNRAILTLSDGSQVILDSVANGVIGKEENVQVIKLQDGKLAYNDGSPSAAPDSKPVYNTISTPRGGQYQVTLPDGTAVWLNSASSITFPTSFTGDERTVTITGEAYFEVAHQVQAGGKRVPFVVDAMGNKTTVLGTHFNINAYADEGPVRTTLIEGSVQVSSGAVSAVLRPGEQSRLGKNSYAITQPDLEEVLAWKNGKFLFRKTDAKAIMRQISRWYDVDIHYKGDLSGILFSGSISKKDNIEKLVEILELDGRIHFELKGRDMTVMSK
ncbi:FecR domain-containing protein [Chitinophagaceae bacterium LB-8]|uniref:FecR domain-containing protein n=1 Tax=Paraflavisolibacter caeni TaxID=2982496 RepID=A0A9X2XWG8_9BACT|nr:FecR family protein [Paraflavisolibacter caeni]MCU7549912.1 FecR domain-containing protein [Paraflavisolibacter caeni]